MLWNIASNTPVTDELSNREANILAKRITSGNINPRLTFESFDFRFNNTAFPLQTSRDLASCHFVERSQNLIACGPPGIGKTHISNAIAHEVCRRGYDALFFKTHKLLEQLGKAATIITSNRPVEDWYAVFPDPIIGGAVLDRFASGVIKLVNMITLDK